MAVLPDVTNALDATGRRFAFRPAAILGNGSLLTTISERGEIQRLFWPSVDHGQHLGELRLGLERGGRRSGSTTSRAPGSSPTWTAPRFSARGQTSAGYHVEIADLVTPAEPVLVRGVRSSNHARLVVRIAPESRRRRAQRSRLRRSWPRRARLLPPRRRAGGRADRARHDDDLARVERARGAHDVVVHRAPVEGSISGALVGEALVLAAFGATPDEAIARLRRPATVGFDVLVVRAGRVRPRDDRTCVSVPGGRHRAELYARSLLVLEQLTDRQTGATIAAPEFDPSFEQSGGYGFVWPRDLGYVVLSFLAAGRGDLAVPALRWLAREQAPEGLWLQRYWTDGSLAPSWGLHQLDETGMVVFSYEAAWRELGDAALDRELWPSARAAADFLCGFMDDDTGLPLPSVDLWEQTDGQHSYSAAATYGGLVAAAAMAARHEPALAERYREMAERVRAAIEEHLWSEEHGRYLRSGGSVVRTSWEKSRLPRSIGRCATRRSRAQRRP